MTRRGRLVSLLVALMALSGAYAAPGTTLASGRAIASIAWSRSERTQAQVRRQAGLQVPAAAFPSTSLSIAWEPSAPSNSLPLSRFQRPPPAL